MFKSWQVFAFSFIPLVLVFAGVIIGSIHGSDSKKEVFPTPAPSTQSGPAPTPVPGATVIQLTAQNLLFDKRSVSAVAGQPVSVQFDNKDSGVTHNVSFYSDSRYTTAIYKGALELGPKIDT